VIRLPSPTARPWLLRWLLVVATLAGLSIWQGGHCADDMAVDPRAGAVASAVGFHAGDTASDAPGVAASRTATEHRHPDAFVSTSPQAPGTTAHACLTLPATVAATTTAAAAVSLPDGARTTPDTPPLRPLQRRPQPDIVLAHIGVSRT
jgi:hypothetical protein